MISSFLYKGLSTILVSRLYSVTWYGRCKPRPYLVTQRLGDSVTQKSIRDWSGIILELISKNHRLFSLFR